MLLGVIPIDGVRIILGKECTMLECTMLMLDNVNSLMK